MQCQNRNKGSRTQEQELEREVCLEQEPLLPKQQDPASAFLATTGLAFPETFVMFRDTETVGNKDACKE